MTTTSATGGFLQLSPVHGHTAIEDVIHDLIAGITGLCGELVRPRWQPDPPRIPKPDVRWCAFGITNSEPQNFPAITHHSEGDGCDEITDYEELTVLASFYGPQHMDTARLLRRGIHVPQNRAILRPNGLAFVKTGNITPVPELVAMQWRARADIPLFFRLETRSTYAVLNLKKISGSVSSDSQTQGGKQGTTVSIGCQACPRACWRIE